MTTAGRIIGLDVGDVRTGVAMSDPLGMFASPRGTIAMADPAAAAQEIATLVGQEGVSRIVAGLPLDQHGQPGRQAEKVLGFLERLKGVVDVPVETVDERFTTAAAERALIGAGMKRKGRKQHVDQVAAAHILQTWLDRQANARGRAGETQ